MPKKQLIGFIVSDKMDKTRVVEVERLKEHPKYLRRYVSHERYKAHDENNEYRKGDKVVLEEARPLSGDKRFKIIKKL